ncbi:MAG: hypothetical protein AABW59_00570 [archaeon]
MVLQFVKDIYFSLEEKWYALIDKINKHVPIYGIVDAVDSVVPSFALFLLLILFVLLAGLAIFFSFQQSYQVEFTVLDSTNKIVSDSKIFVKVYDGQTKILDTNILTDNDGKFSITDLKAGQRIDVNINLSKGTFFGPFTVSETKQEEVITLDKAIAKLEAVKRNILLRSATGMAIRNEAIEVSFFCENSSVTPDPASAVDDGDGIITVTEPVNCVKLYVKSISPEYQVKTYYVNSTSYEMMLIPYEPPTNSLKVKVRMNGIPISDSSFTINLTGKNTYTKVTGTGSETTIDLVPGTYFLAVSDTKGIYASVSKNIDINGDSEQVIEVTKAVRARINVKVVNVANSQPINGAVVSIKNSKGQIIQTLNTDASGLIIPFALTDLGDYIITAKKPGDLNGGFYTKTMELKAITGDMNITLSLEAITTANAGRVTVRVVDQDAKPIDNAKIILKYVADDSIVELNAANNYFYTDLNGYTTFLAGKVEGTVYAYAIKYPFSGSSNPKAISLEADNLFDITMTLGSATVIVNVVDDLDEKLDGEAELLLANGTSVSGVLSIEQGFVQSQIKAGQSVYLLVKVPGYNPYYTETTMLWPDQTTVFDVKLKKDILEPEIALDGDGVYNESGKIVRTLQAGKKYYMKFRISADQSYDQVAMHFRAGKGALLENDYVEIDTIESTGVTSEVKGASYNPEKGYTFDSLYTVDGPAKWVNLQWEDFGQSIRAVKIWFKVKNDASSNKEVQFYWNADFDLVNKPEDTNNTQNSLYDNTYQSDIYLIGQEATCEEPFCVANEWFYSSKEDLYLPKPYELHQVDEYTYHYQIVNNSNIDYSKAKKPLYLSITLLGEEGKEIKIKSYVIKDPLGTVSGGEASEIKNVSIGSFEDSAAIDITLKIQGITESSTSLVTELKSEGSILFSTDTSFSVVSDKPLSVSVAPTFVTSMVDEELSVTVKDSDAEPVNEALVTVYAKEPGFEQYGVYSALTSRMGIATVFTGPHYPNAKIIIEVAKEGFSVAKLQLTVSDTIVAFAPTALNSTLNTIDPREEILEVSIGNLTQHGLVLLGVNIDSEFEGIINEEALTSYVEQFAGTEVPANDVVDLDLVRVRLANDLTTDSYIEPIDVTGNLILSFSIPDTSQIYDATIPLNVSVSSDANPSASCLVVTDATQTKTTERGQVSFYFELQNACQTESGADIPLEELWATSGGEYSGIANLSIQSTVSTNGGMIALDGSTRKVMSEINAGEKFMGTLTYAPDTSESGTTVTIPLTITGKFQGNTINTNPSSMNFTVSIVNLKECMTITSSSAPVAFDETSQVTIDATKCLGQNVEAYLCKGDSGCSGGAEGKISLSKRILNLNNTSETIDAYGPSLPGSYGVSVWARVKGNTSFSYIGEVAVSFKEPDEKYFKLSKYEVNIVGEGSQDSILLTNSALTQDIKVKADWCVWGTFDDDISWMTVLTGATLGATLGNMLGKATEDKETTKKKGTGRDDTKASSDKTTGTTDSSTREGMTDSEKTYAAQTTLDTQASLDSGKTGTTYETADGGKITSSTVPAPEPGDGFVEYVRASDGGNVYLNEGTTVFTDSSGHVVGYQATDQTSPTFITSYRQVDSYSSITTGDGELYNITQISSHTSDGAVVPDTTYTNLYNPSSDKTLTVTYNSAAGNAGTSYAAGTAITNYDNSWGGNLAQHVPLSSWWNNVWSSGSYGENSSRSSTATSGTVTQSPVDEFLKNPIKLSFAAFNSGAIHFPGAPVTNPSLNASAPKIGLATYGANFWLTLTGAVVGGILAYIAQEAECDDEYDVVTFTDFYIFLAGQTLTITGTGDAEDTTRDVPSDAGALSFSLDGVSLAWNFENADYSSVENVAINFTNEGLNDAEAQYGTMIINATTHQHGNASIPGVEGSSTSTSESDKDVLCRKNTFGEYWIGSDVNDGYCTDISEGTFSQKYHIRVISGEPADQEAYIKKANSCYTGVLTGSTGVDAVPRVKLDWDWQSIDMDSCDYGNSNYIYCDATQFTIAMTKKLAALQEFFKKNPTLSCPENPTDTAREEALEELNTSEYTVPTGYIGVKNVTVTVEDNVATAIVTLDNKYGSAYETTLTTTQKGGDSEEPDPYIDTYSIPAGESTRTYEYTIPAYNGTYYFTAVVNGDYGTRRAISRSFTNKDPSYADSCWIAPSTRAEGGLPSILYYISADSDVGWTTKIPDAEALYSAINFGSYLIKDNYTEDFYDDFVRYYQDEFMGVLTDDERDALDYMDSGKYSLVKRFSGNGNSSGDTEVQAGLYDVWLNMDFNEQGGDYENFVFLTDPVEDSASTEASVLLIKVPTTNSPFYNLPIDGEVGYDTGREGYGSAYTNEGEDEVSFNNGTETFEKASSNAMVTVTTQTNNAASYETANVSIATRGVLAAISSSSSGAEILFTPNYATPVILKYSLDGTSGYTGIEAQENDTPITDVSNLSYWTGAAKSKDFYGQSAVDVYYNTPDSILDVGDNAYGFTWTDATVSGTMYLKTFIYVPTAGAYKLVSKEGSTAIWTADNDFTSLAPLTGIGGMQYNSATDMSMIETIDDLFTAVENGDVCVSGDGSNMSFWWNPAVLENSPGNNDSLANKELGLAGS